MAKIVNTDNFGGDYPNETFLGLDQDSWVKDPAAALTLEADRAQVIASAINRKWSCNGLDENCPRYAKIVEDDYELQPGFEP